MKLLIIILSYLSLTIGIFNMIAAPFNDTMMLFIVQLSVGLFNILTGLSGLNGLHNEAQVEDITKGLSKEQYNQLLCDIIHQDETERDKMVVKQANAQITNAPLTNSADHQASKGHYNVVVTPSKKNKEHNDMYYDQADNLT